jgi:hypothetical protein
MHATNPSLDQNMRTSIACLALVLLATAPSSMGQLASVNFNNRVTGAGGVVAPIYGPSPSDPLLRLSGNATTNGGSIDYTGFPLLSGTGFTAELWAENPANPGIFVSLFDVDARNVGAKITFRTAATLPGFVFPVNPAPLVPWVTSNQDPPVRFQVRVWDNHDGVITTWAQALADSRASGYSDIFSTQLVIPPGLPANLTGLTSFNIQGVFIPEPSVVVLGTLAGLALLWQRKNVSR